MKMISSILLICCTSFVCATNEPIFQETNEPVKSGMFRAFACKEETLPSVDDGKVHILPIEEESAENPITLPSLRAMRPNGMPSWQVHYSHWYRYKAEYGIEQVFTRFPQAPTITRTSTMVTAHAYDGLIVYSMNGYFPPANNIIPSMWFDEILLGCNSYPYVLKAYSTNQVNAGVYMVDYIAHDIAQNTILKGRAIVTPFNGYILQCVKPNGFNDDFDYFVDNFWIKY